MSESVGKNAIEKIFETAQKRNFQRVKFKYAGGEATLHFHLVKELCHYAQTIADEKGIALDQVILSNGTNIHEKDADWLSESATKLMISLDATGEYHDHIRHQKNGTGSFTLIENTVDRILLPRGIHPFITITIFRENASYIAAAVRWALARDCECLHRYFGWFSARLRADNRIQSGGCGDSGSRTAVIARLVCIAWGGACPRGGSRWG